MALEERQAMAETVAREPVRPISIGRHPIYSLFLPVPVVCFLGALITDLSYLNSGGNLLWVNFSAWLLAAGLLFGAIALVIFLIEAIRGRPAWLAFALLLIAWIVEFINSLVHARDGWTAVAGAGLVLSIIGALLVLAAGWLSRRVVEVAP
jgi:uncharacterized membrane protein